MSDLQSMGGEAHQAMESRAADFVQRRRLWDWTDTDQAEFEAWLGESILHRVTYLRLEAGAERIEKLVALRPSNPAEPSRHEDEPRLRYAIPLMAAASLILVAFIGIVAARYLAPPTPDRRALTTDIGGRASLGFADGTEIRLNTDTAIFYRITTAERTVWLEKGEAWFRVTHDAARPFNVFVGTHRITDLGTEFLVRDDAAKLEVALIKGRARLSAGSARAQTAMLTPGDDAIATSVGTTVTKKTAQELADATAWQRGVLVFRNTRLDAAIGEFNRYNKIKLVISDPAVARLTIGGEFKTNNIDDFLQLAQLVLKLHVDRQGDEIMLSRGPGRSKTVIKTRGR